MSERRVNDCMRPGVVACAPDAGLEEVAAIMREPRIGAVVVMKDGAALGVISQTDLVNIAFIRPYLRYWRGMEARHLMTAPAISVRSDTPLGEALTLLRARIGAYTAGVGAATLPADAGVARSLIPAGTAALRDFSYLAPEIPELVAERCVGRMTGVTECPDTAILGKGPPGRAGRPARELAPAAGAGRCALKGGRPWRPARFSCR